jgi:hypothetical protein
LLFFFLDPFEFVAVQGEDYFLDSVVSIVRERAPAPAALA